jgi:hypothetical protein
LELADDQVLNTAEVNFPLQKRCILFSLKRCPVIVGTFISHDVKPDARLLIRYVKQAILLENLRHLFCDADLFREVLEDVLN